MKDTIVLTADSYPARIERVARPLKAEVQIYLRVRFR